jgi:hypothetical protein
VIISAAVSVIPAIIPGVIPTAIIPGGVPTAVVPWTVPTVPATVIPGVIPTTVIPRGIPAAIVPWTVPTVPATVVPRIVPWVKAVPTPADMQATVPTPVVVIFVYIVTYVHDHLIGTCYPDTRLRVVKANDSISVLVLFVIVDVGLFFYSGSIVTPTAVVLINIPAVCDHLHTGSLSLHNYHLFLGWLFSFIGLNLSFISSTRRIRVDIVPLLGET